MDVYAPTSQTLRFHWDRVRYELLDRRSAILAALDSHGLLRGFNPLHDSLAIQLADRRTVEVQLDSAAVHEHIGAQIKGPSSTELAVEIGQTLGVQSALPDVAFQHLVAWPEGVNAQAAFARGSAALVNDAADLGVTDFALLFDGVASEVWTYQAEVGIIQGQDAQDRLKKLVGRSPAPRPLVSVQTPQIDFPSVATFVDSFWMCATRKQIELTDASKLALTAAPEARRLVQALHERLCVEELGPN